MTMTPKSGINDKIIELIKGRLEKGAKAYNQEVQLNDTRDFTQEALEEVLDGLVYTAAKLIQLISAPVISKNPEPLKVGYIIRIKGNKFLVGIKTNNFKPETYYGLFNLGPNYTLHDWSSCRNTLEEMEKDLRSRYGSDGIEIISRG